MKFILAYIAERLHIKMAGNGFAASPVIGADGYTSLQSTQSESLEISQLLSEIESFLIIRGLVRSK